MIQKPPTGQADILIVDDTLENLELLTEMLKRNGCKVRPVTGGVPALQAARSAPPDLILLDINMPDMSGYDVCRHLQADEALKGIPVIFISALGDAMDKVKAFQCGGVDYITKPFWVDEVLARASTHLRIRQLQLELERHNAGLEETVRARTREISEARDQLADANHRLGILDKAKSDFLSIISLFGGSVSVTNLDPAGIRLDVRLKSRP
jgi:DNA-binding response OmpR family regulator